MLTVCPARRPSCAARLDLGLSSSHISAFPRTRARPLLGSSATCTTTGAHDESVHSIQELLVHAKGCRAACACPQGARLRVAALSLSSAARCLASGHLHTQTARTRAVPATRHRAACSRWSIIAGQTMCSSLQPAHRSCCCATRSARSRWDFSRLAACCSTTRWRSKRVAGWWRFCERQTRSAPSKYAACPEGTTAPGAAFYGV